VVAGPVLALVPAIVALARVPGSRCNIGHEGVEWLRASAEALVARYVTAVGRQALLLLRA
jgi:hypothetical protein